MGCMIRINNRLTNIYNVSKQASKAFLYPQFILHTTCGSSCLDTPCGSILACLPSVRFAFDLLLE